MSLRSLHITKADRVVLLGMLRCVKVLTRSLRQPKGIIKDRRWRQKNGKQIPLFGVISSHRISSSCFFFFFFCFFPRSLFSHSSPNALWVCGKLSKAHVSKAAQNKTPMMPCWSPHCLLIIPQSFSVCERKGSLINPVMWSSLAVWEPQCKKCFNDFDTSLTFSSSPLTV